MLAVHVIRNGLKREGIRLSTVATLLLEANVPALAALDIVAILEGGFRAPLLSSPVADSIVSVRVYHSESQFVLRCTMRSMPLLHQPFT